ncbi:hypothetical protein BD779DRAFT_1677775 [Infundibulicybe gibba]|nr:hypothetical protein BD779DRAFT_1677775 [Infundibulicybe gibba]
MSAYNHISETYAALPAFAPIVPVALLPSTALVLLTSTFALAFYFSTLPKDTLPLREMTVAATASTLAGFGVVALFCSVGVYV